MPFHPPPDASLLWRLLWILSWILRPLCCTIRVEGLEHVPPRAGFVLASNHSMGPDYVALGHVLPRQIYFMAKSEAFGANPLLAKFLLQAGVFPVQRGKHDLAALEASVALVRAGKALGMYPEGTRSRDRTLQRGKSGAVRIAMMADAPLVPAVVLNADQIMGGFTRLRNKPLVTVRFGAPLHFAGDVDDAAAIRRNLNESMVAIARLLPEEQRGVYAGAVAEAEEASVAARRATEASES